MSDVRIFPGEGKRDVTAMLEAAKSADLDSVLILGWGKDGDQFISGSMDNGKDILYTLTACEFVLMFDSLYAADD